MAKQSRDIGRKKQLRGYIQKMRNRHSEDTHLKFPYEIEVAEYHPMGIPKQKSVDVWRGVIYRTLLDRRY